MTVEWDKLKAWITKMRDESDWACVDLDGLLTKMKSLERSAKRVKRDPLDVERSQRLAAKAKSPKKRATG